MVSDKCSGDCLSKISTAISKTLENGFNKYGNTVASHPLKFIALCFVITGLCCIGLINFYSETRTEKLWIPQDSDYVQNFEWQKENFPNDRRLESVIYKANENILTSKNILLMFEYHQKVAESSVNYEDGEKKAYDDLCVRIPVNGQTSKCLETTILQLWEDDITVIEKLTDKEILDAINDENTSEWFKTESDFKSLLGEVVKDDAGRIISAKTALNQWFMNINRTDIEEGGTVTDSGAAEDVDRALYDWEGEFLKIFDTEKLDGIEIFVQAGRSFGEVAGETILGDVVFIAVGTMVLFVFVVITLGKFNAVEKRPILSLMGLVSCGMAIGMSYGLCSAFGIPYGPVHSVLPILIIGIGVDDMFVIVQCWKNLHPEERINNLKTRIGTCLGHAGVAITVTSLTDFLAFGIGATTVLPALQSFCLYCAIGIVALYLLQATFFVAWFALDQSRLEKNRNGFFWCYEHKNFKPNKCSQNDLSEIFFKKFYAPILTKTPSKLVVLLVTCVLFGVAIWGLVNLKQEFDPLWFIPPSSYVSKFFQQLNKYYTKTGESGNIYLGSLKYSEEISKIRSMTSQLQDDQIAKISSIDSWCDQFCDNYAPEGTCDGTITEFETQLYKFLFDPKGYSYRNYFNFEEELLPDSSLPKIIATKIPYVHELMKEDRNDRINAMDKVKDIINKQDFSDYAAAISDAYLNWETDKIIAEELVRNMILAMVSVFIMTLLLIANFFASFYVLLCVALTLVNVMGLMYFWDLTIDTVSCINLVVSIGLSVDYSAHIGLHFMQVDGTRDERVRKTLSEMGPAVLNGAFSTFLAFIFLAGSESHVFKTFFKILFGVFIYGVYHGLVFLPVILSIIGPKPYKWVEEEAEERNKEKMKIKEDAAYDNKSDILVEKF